MTKTTKAIVQAQPKYDIVKPEQMKAMANVLKDHIKKNALSVQIVGRDYVMVEGWQFAGGLMGFFPRIVKVECIGTMKWLAQAEIVNQRTGAVAGTGFALCSKDEMKKKSFDEYAILSMAQTRAIGKAFRNLIGWIIKMAGYESTPAEEIGKKGPVVAESAKTAETKVPTTYVTQLKAMIHKMGAKNQTEALKILKDKTGVALKDFNITEKHASILVASLLNIR